MDDWTHGAKTEAPDGTFLRDGTAFRDDKGKLPGVKAKPRSRLRSVVLLGIAVLLGLGIYRVSTALRAPKSQAPISKPRRSRLAWPPSEPVI